MSRRNSIIALALGVLFAALTFLTLYQRASEIEKKTTPVSILVAAHYIPAGSVLTSDMVVKKLIPESFISPSAVQDIKELENLMALVPLSSGEQILANKFGASGDSLAFNLSDGYRAYTIDVNETSGVGNLIHPGNHVDVIAKISSNKHEITSFVFQNIKVIAVGQKIAATPNKEKDPETNEGYSTVTLALTPDQCETLMYLEGQHLRLLLRSPTDDEIVSISSKTETDIFSKLGRFSAIRKRDQNSEKEKLQ